MPDKIVNHFVLANGSTARYSAEHLAGSVPEVVGIRTGYDGTTYANAGDAVRGQVRKIETDLSETTSNLLNFADQKTINGVIFSNKGAKGLKLSGTATSGGGRTTHLTDNLTLPAGTYYFCVFANKVTPNFFVEDINGNTILLTAGYSNFIYPIDLATETSIYIGVNVVNAVEYDLDFYIYLGRNVPSAIPNTSAVDFIAREQLKRTKNLKLTSYSSVKELFPFEIGSFNSANNTKASNTRYRLISAVNYYTAEPIMVTMPSGYRFGVVFFDSEGNVSSDSGWQTGSFVIPADSTFLLQLAKDPEDNTIIITNIETSDLYQNLTMTANFNTNIITDIESGILSAFEMNVPNKWSQGACKVGDIVIGFDASAGDHTSNGRLYRYDISNGFSQYDENMYHNLGHCSSADYMESTNTAIVANGTYTEGSDEEVYLIKNMKEKIANGGEILITNNDVIRIDVSDLTGVSCGACFGETDQIMYVLKVESATQYDVQTTKYIYKCLLGKGNTDLTSTFSSNSYGTFISDCADNEYNGTIHILETYEIPVYGELQGLKYRNDVLYMSLDTRHFSGLKTPFIAKIDFKNETVNYYRIPFYSNETGELIAGEAEGFVFDGANGYISIIGSNLYKIYKFNAIF